jgi:hypothetical protein
MACAGAFGPGFFAFPIGQPYYRLSWPDVNLALTLRNEMHYHRTHRGLSGPTVNTLLFSAAIGHLNESDHRAEGFAGATRAPEGYDRKQHQFRCVLTYKRP